ncbi:hypothetical protein EEB12_07895 [Rhodococcus sp. WS1]|uniref:Uncharacterized protein n=1 Tax=Rhodococcus erythropolis TaxID=1833 RepID=A0A0C2VRE6_RHOER|nr:MULTISPECIES: hypothetical protein [Rhodococcus]AGT91321.1 hypothetical protein O5Y_07250 [Rhodococcus erythropolis CCM2595]MCW0190191.1 hypothetical protein [Rhodococcus sp. (in: high G+C Gram-positive bacteria)]NRH34577.1 hypothetical protein [Rhodococcus sp. MS13]ROZ60824.1 hypothetical protein EEB12_07895 [Rhodococcus sp. WS1]TQC37210.1 hypothetical protein EEB16_14560 [Rhodococcus sp. WS7]
MDTASLIDAVGSIDANSVQLPLAALKGIIEGVFAAISSFIELGVTGSAASAGSIQSGLGSIAGT